jgi:ketosteroid isomerase-like protein
MTNSEVVLVAIKAVEERDAELLFGLHHEEVEFHDAASLPYGGIRRSKAAIVEEFRRDPLSTWLGTWGPVQPTERERRMDPRIVAENGNEVVALYTQRAVAPNGERFESPVVGLYEVRDEKLARAQMFHYDTAAIAGFLSRARRSEA